MSVRVVQAFGNYSVGDEVTDDKKVKAILDSEQSHYVVLLAPEEVSEPKESK